MLYLLPNHAVVEIKIAVATGIWTEDCAMMAPRKTGMAGEETDPGIAKPRPSPA